MAVNSRTKGANFERKIAQDMREIYDPPKLLKLMKVSTPKKRSQLLKSSAVRRGRQTEGAVESDLVVKGCPCWLELQDASKGKFSPLNKLRQAERDVNATKVALYPVAICHLKGSRNIATMMRLSTLVDLVGGESQWGFREDFPVLINYDDFRDILKWRGKA